MNDVLTANDMDSSVKSGMRLRFDDLAPHDVELSEDEIRAVSGGLAGQWVVSWTSGPSHGADEWIVK
jgi:hypothetical protein